MTSVGTLVGQLENLGVEEGGVLLVHTSFRAIRPVEGGPGGLIEALFERLGPQGTLVMPSWPEDANEPYDPARSPVDHGERRASPSGYCAECAISPR